MKVSEEMVMLVIQQRHQWIKEYSNFWKELYDLSDVEKYIDQVKPLIDEIVSLLEEYKKEQAEKCSEIK